MKGEYSIFEIHHKFISMLIYILTTLLSFGVISFYSADEINERQTTQSKDINGWEEGGGR